MLKKKTSVRRNLHTLVGGDWIAAENSARNSCINLVPEFPMAAPYRGNFQVVQSNAGRVKVVNSAFYDEDDEKDDVPAHAGNAAAASRRLFTQDDGMVHADNACIHHVLGSRGYRYILDIQ